MSSDALMVLVYGSVTALATGLGALPFLFVASISDRVVAYANAAAAGLMLGASFGLVAEGTEHGSGQTVVGVTLGLVFILATQKWLCHRNIVFAGTDGASARKMMLIVVVMTVHSFAEGVALGSAFGGGMTLAAVITAAIAVHNVPEGVAISAVLRCRGSSLLACAGWSIFSSLPQPLMAVPAFLFVDTFRPALPYGLGFAAGAMIFMVLEELLPEAYDQAPRPAVGLFASLTLVGMVLFQRSL